MLGAVSRSARSIGCDSAQTPQETFKQAQTAKKQLQMVQADVVSDSRDVEKTLRRGAAHSVRCYSWRYRLPRLPKGAVRHNVVAFLVGRERGRLALVVDTHDALSDKAANTIRCESRCGRLVVGVHLAQRVTMCDKVANTIRSESGCGSLVVGVHNALRDCRANSIQRCSRRLRLPRLPKGAVCHSMAAVSVCRQRRRHTLVVDPYDALRHWAANTIRCESGCGRLIGDAKCTRRCCAAHSV
jgi:hypothetical protein